MKNNYRSFKSVQLVKDKYVEAPQKTTSTQLNKTSQLHKTTSQIKPTIEQPVINKYSPTQAADF